MKSVIVVAAFVFAGAAHAKEKPFEGLYEKRRGVAALLKDTMRGAAERDTLEQTLKAIDAHYERLATEVLGENRDGVLSDACGRPADPIVRFLCALAVAQKPAGAGRLLALLRETKNLAYQLSSICIIRRTPTGNCKCTHSNSRWPGWFRWNDQYDGMGCK